MIAWIYLLVAGLLAGLAILVRWKKATWLIAGYNTAPQEEKEKYDVEKLCLYVGNFLFLLALIWLVMAGAVWLRPDQLLPVTITGLVVEAVVIVGGLIYLNTNNRLMK